MCTTCGSSSSFSSGAEDDFFFLSLETESGSKSNSNGEVGDEASMSSSPGMNRLKWVCSGEDDPSSALLSFVEATADEAVAAAGGSTTNKKA